MPRDSRIFLIILDLMMYKALRILSQLSVTRFVGVSGIVFILDLLIALVLAKALGAPLFAASIVGFSVGVILNYFIHEFWTFADRKGAWSAFRLRQYIGAAFAALGSRLLVISLFSTISLSVFGTLIVLVAASGLSLSLNYFLSRYLVFSAENNTKSVRSSPSLTFIVFVILSTLAITHTFEDDTFGTLSNFRGKVENFSSGARDTVYARLIKSEVNGFWSDATLGGFIYARQGNGGSGKPFSSVELFETNDQNGKAAALDAYVIPYTGNILLQGDLVILLDFVGRQFGLEPPERRVFFRNSIRLLTAFSLALLLGLAITEFGLVAAFVGLISILGSPWLVYFSPHVYWSPYAWFFPIAISWAFFVQSDVDERFSVRTAYLAMGSAIFLKTLMGFEYITGIVILCCAAAIYTPLASGNIRQVVIRGLGASVACVLGLLASFVVTILVLASYFGSFAEAIERFGGKVSKRTSLVGGDNPLINMSVPELIEHYFTFHPVVKFYAFEMTAKQLTISLAIASLLSFCVLAFLRKFTKKHFAQATLMILALAASLSWYVIANGHSEGHRHLNNVLWHLGWVIFGVVITVSICRDAFVAARQWLLSRSQVTT